MFRLKITAITLPLLALLVLLAGPAPAAAQMASHSYQVTITNLTTKQVLSPPILATHPSAMHVWQAGQLASEGLRIVAEDGKSAALAAALQGQVTEIQALGEMQMVMPGQSVTVMIHANSGDVLSAAMMLVQTNDGFTGLDNVALTGTALDLEAMAYDAGTEQNTEMASDVPGPPFMGMARPATEPRQPIAMHPGISGNAAVTADYGWTGPVARISIRALPGMPTTGRGGENPLPQYVLAGGLTLILVAAATRRLARSG